MTEGLRLGDHSEKIGSGATPRGGKDVYLSAGPYSLIRSQNVHNHGFEFSGLVFISEEQARRLDNVEVHEGDVLVNITGDSVARVCRVHPAALPARVNQHVAIIRPKAQEIDPLFLRYWLITPAVQARLLGLASAGATRNALTKAMLEGLRVPALALRKQQTIAEILGSLDDKIELNRRTNETLEGMAQAIFRDWFVDFGPTRRRLDGATDPIEIIGGLVQDSERARLLADHFPAVLSDDGIPDGWGKRPLLDQANWINGAAYKNMHFSEAPNALPVVKIAELKSGVTASTKRTATELGDKYRIGDGEVLFSWSGNPDTSIDTFIWTGGDAWLNQHIFAVRDNGSRTRASLYVLLKYLRPDFAELARNKQTTGLGHVTKEDMKRLLVTAAPSAVEESFDRIVGPMIDLVTANLFETRTLTTTRDLLLPKLMSGELRSRDAGDYAAAAQ